MDDVLSQGGDRDPSPWPRRLGLIAALVAAVAGGVVYLTRPQHQPAPAAARQTPAPVRVSAAPASLDGPGAPPGPSGIIGRTLAWDPSVRLPVTGARPVWFSPASGGSEPIGGLPADPAGYQFTRVVGGWAIQVRPTVKTACGDCVGAPTMVWFLGDGAQSAVPVGLANLVAPGSGAGTVWLTSYAPGVDTAAVAGTAREAGASGALTRPVRLPAGYAIDRGTRRGLLLVPVRPGPGTVPGELWDPSAPRVSSVFSQVVAASPGGIAWLAPCSPRCGVQVLNLGTGRRTRIALPAGQSVTSAAFSPDGSYLALQVSSASSGDGGELAMRLEVASGPAGRLSVVPGTFVSSDALVGFGWPARGDHLVAEFSFTTRIQLASWRPGASRPAVAALRPVAGPGALILG